jgi:ubiquinone/menaquinone biosynthesis C-methylase UbiE
MFKTTKNKIKTMLRAKGLRSFLTTSKNQSGALLDVGCGNESSVFINSVNPKIEIHGIDVCDYNQSVKSKKLYAVYTIAPADEFDIYIKKIDGYFNYITSNHNIEHCNKPEKVFDAMIEKLMPGGMLFIASPSLSSTAFPSRMGTLNFFDDSTHKLPVDLLGLYERRSSILELVFYSKSYRPLFWRIIGFLNETASRKRKKVQLGTWDYYGFEQIMWLKKK